MKQSFLSSDPLVRPATISLVAFVVDEETIVYEFTIDDPGTYTEVWGGEVPRYQERTGGR